MTAEKAQDKQGPVSVDGGWFAVVDGEWQQVPNPDPPAQTVSSSSMSAGGFEQGPVSVDGAWFALVDGEWKQVGYAGLDATHPRRTIPEGYVSVDGTLFPVDRAATVDPDDC